jgi:alpha-tubulin suppressor-like RCC1 family protein
MSGLEELKGIVVWWMWIWLWMQIWMGFVCLSMCSHVWCCRYGQLGHGAFASYVAHPTLVAPAVTLPGSTASVASKPVITAVSCGTYFTLLVTDAGRLLACGRNK